MDYTDELADRAEVLAVKQTLKWGSNSGLFPNFLALFAEDLRARRFVVNDPQVDLASAFWRWHDHYKAKTRS